MTVGHDLRHVFRGIRKAPAFSLVVTLTVALGVGATTAIFSLVEAVLLRPLPYPAERSLVKLFDVQSDTREVDALSFPEFVDWRDRGRDVFQAIGAWDELADKAEPILDIRISDGGHDGRASPFFLHFDHIRGCVPIA